MFQTINALESLCFGQLIRLTVVLKVDYLVVDVLKVDYLVVDVLKVDFLES